MKKYLIIAIVVLTALVSAAQEPQWVVISNVSAFQQTNGVAQTTLFTPSEDGFYRISLYFSTAGGGASPGGLTANFLGEDVTGQSTGGGEMLNCTYTQIRSIGPQIYALKANQPFSYSIVVAGAGCVYNFGLVVEQLM